MRSRQLDGIFSPNNGEYEKHMNEANAQTAAPFKL